MRLLLYTRTPCPLCDEMKEAIERARLGRETELLVVDVDAEPGLADRYGRSVPVLEIAGRVAFQGRLTPSELEREFARIVAEVGA